MQLQELKAEWNEVLNHLESTNRIAWMAMFDGRLVSLENNVLTLDFSDALKLAGHHDMKSASASLERHIASLEASIQATTGLSCTISILESN